MSLLSFFLFSGSAEVSCYLLLKFINYNGASPPLESIHIMYRLYIILLISIYIHASVDASIYTNDRSIQSIEQEEMSDHERELQLKYEEKCKEVDRLNIELEYSKQQLEDLRKKNCELEIRVDHLEDELTQLKSNMKKLEDSIKDKEVEKALLEKEKANMETDLWKAKAENERIKREAVELEMEKLCRRLSKHSLSKEDEVETLGKQNTDMIEVEKEMWKTTAENERKEVEREAREEMVLEKLLSSQKPVQHALSETSQNHNGGPPSHISNHARPPGPNRRHSAASAADKSHRRQLRTSVCTPQLTLPSLPISKSADSLQSQ